ncbi:phosphatase PAP2 family protein [Pirellulales bacterium]|nr:phosphatase PAP2 family protein [Pirellulales bacterium]
MISSSCFSCLRFGPLQPWQWCLFCFVIVLEFQLPHGGFGAEPNSIANELSSGRSARNSLPVASDGMFLSSKDGHVIWDKTVKTVAADWPVTKTIPPDFDSVPPRAGMIESAWVEVPHSTAPRDMSNGFVAPWPHWPQQRQRVVVQVLPAANGAWVDAVVETQPLAANDASLMPDRVVLTGGWETELQGRSSVDATVDLAQRMEFESEPVYALPTPPEFISSHKTQQLPWEESRFPRLSRTGQKISQDYKNFYSCENLACVTAAFGAGALMANTGFDTTMQNAWQTGITGSQPGDFFSATKDIGDGIYLLPAAGIAAAAGVALEGVPVGDALGGWGSRSLRIFLVGGPPVYVLQLATGASRPSNHGSINTESPSGSDWKFFQDNNGVSGHSFMGAIPFLAAADMVEHPLAKGTLYVCSTFVGFSRINDDAHYSSQAFLGWYLAWASSLAVSRTEHHFAGYEVRIVPVPIGDQGGLGVQASW